MPRTDRRPRQRLDAETRRAGILKAAGEAFTAQPYDKVSVARIAAAAGASEALVHRYYPGKAGLYLAVCEAGHRQLIERQRAAFDPALAVRAQLVRSVTIYLDAVREWSVGWLGPLRASGGEPAEAVALRRRSRQTWVEQLRELLRLPAGTPADYALLGYLDFLDAACLHWAERGYPEDDREIITAQVVAALAAALAVSGHPGNPASTLDTAAPAGDNAGHDGA